MRLLKTASATSPTGLKLVAFEASVLVPYAILSHTWTNDEVLYSDVLNGTSTSRRAFAKVRSACKLAAARGYDYIWIDTCCIDKSSSAELSESINSMFDWYRRATVCYAYLADFDPLEGKLEDCRWFTRGFTLQELIAPADVVFYNSRWTEIGDKHTLCREISDITSISDGILVGARPLEEASIANRMGWAAHRVTTRPEDVAYCLMGIFSVNMPLLYGEGDKAFLRLQEEIMKNSTDHTLFAWVDEEAPDSRKYGLLAPSPRCFAKTRMIVPYPDWGKPSPYSMTNEGLSINLPIQGGPSIVRAILNCPTPDYDDSCFVVIYLSDTGADGSSMGERFARVNANRLGSMPMDHNSLHDERPPAKHIYVKARSRQASIKPATVFPKQMMRPCEGPATSEYPVLLMTAYPFTHRIPVPPGQGYWSSRYPPNVPVRRGRGHVSLVVVFRRREENARLLLMVGSIDAERLGFSAVEMDYEPDDPHNELEKLPPAEDIEKMFKPRPLGELLNLANHDVHAEATTHEKNIVKFYDLRIMVWPSGYAQRNDAPLESEHKKIDGFKLVRVPKQVKNPRKQQPEETGGLKERMARARTRAMMALTAGSGSH